MIPQDYKRQYSTEEGVGVDPTDQVWVAIVQDVETNEFAPVEMTAKEAEDKGYRLYYAGYEACMAFCDDLNSDAD